jgi:mercuric reductase
MAARLQEVPIRKLAQALQALHEILPLKERQDSLTPAYRELHRSILRSLIEQGRPLDEGEVGKAVGGAEEARQAIALLGAYDLVVLGPLNVTDVRTGRQVVLGGMGGDVVGAYPVTTEKTPHKLKVGGHSLYAMCAVDALAVGAAFDREVEIESACHVTGEPIRIHQRRKEILKATPAARDIRVGVRWQRLATAAAHCLCRQMVFLKDPAVADKWQGRDPATMDVFTLAEAIDFGEAFFAPLMQD